MPRLSRRAQLGVIEVEPVQHERDHGCYPQLQGGTEVGRERVEAPVVVGEGPLGGDPGLLEGVQNDCLQ